jgi:hypothetical protein
MDLAQIIVTSSGVALIAAVLLFFFGPRTRKTVSKQAAARGNRSAV